MREKRRRPGSGGFQPISETNLTRTGERVAPRAGMSAPGARRDIGGEVWAFGLATEIDPRGRETRWSIGRGVRQLLGREQPDHENITDEDPTGFGGYESDDKAVVAKLFGVLLDD